MNYGCSCHISAPCSYCEAHGHCSNCNSPELNDDLIELHIDFFCSNCFVEAAKKRIKQLEDEIKELRK